MHLYFCPPKKCISVTATLTSKFDKGGVIKVQKELFKLCVTAAELDLV